MSTVKKSTTKSYNALLAQKARRAKDLIDSMFKRKKTLNEIKDFIKGKGWEDIFLSDSRFNDSL